MKPLVSRFLCALALALPLVAVLLLPCEQYQDSQTLLPGNTANSSFPSNSTTSTPSPHLACSLYPHRIWSALESLFVPGTFSRAVSYHAASASTQPPASSGVSVQPVFSPHLAGANLRTQPALDLVVIAALLSTGSTATALLFTFAPCYAFKTLRATVKQQLTMLCCCFASVADPGSLAGVLCCCGHVFRAGCHVLLRQDARAGACCSAALSNAAT